MRLLEDYERAPSPVLAVLSSAAFKPLRTQQFLAFLKEVLAPEPPWRRGLTAALLLNRK